MKNWIFGATLSCTLLITGCTSVANKENDALAKRYFDSYAQRADHVKMSSFYADEVVYENVSQNTGLSTLEPTYLLTNILNLEDKSMAYDQDKMLKIKDVLTNDTLIVANGEFSSYTYNGNRFGAMRFTTWLYLDDQKKIKKQVDWFNYPIEDVIELYQLQHAEKFKVEK